MYCRNKIAQILLIKSPQQIRKYIADTSLLSNIHLLTMFNALGSKLDFFFLWKLHHRKNLAIRTTKVKGQQQVTRGSIKQGVKTSLFLNDLCFRIMNDRFRLLTTLTIYPVSKHPDSCKSVKEFAHSCPHNKQIFIVSFSL